MRQARWSWILTGFTVLGLFAATRVHAACNLIPQTTKTFGGVVGAINRPYAAPGEQVELAVRPCDTGSSNIGPAAADQVVTVIFNPNGAAQRNAVVLTAGSCNSLSAQLSTCQAQLGGGQVGCIEGAGTGLRTVDRPDGRHLQFSFPDTDSMIGGANDDLTLAGPATVAVTRSTAAALPCNLNQSANNCATQAGNISGLVACIDDFFGNDGSCGTAEPLSVFGSFTALPPPNNFAADCFKQVPPCNPTATEFRLTTDRSGNALMPMDWSGILLRPNGIPFPRLLSASLSTPLSITFPGQSFFASFTPEGGPLAPIFIPQFNTESSSSVLSLFGSADAPYTILRIARYSDAFKQCQGGVNDGLPCNGPDDCPSQCSAASSNAGQRCTSDAACPGGSCSEPTPALCGPTVCVGGSNAGNACTADAFCPGGKCGPAVFNLAPLTYAGNGPVVLPRQPGVCASGMSSGQACTSLSDCPGSFCLTEGFCQDDTSQACSITNACSSVPCVDFQLTADSPIPLSSLAARTANVFGLSSVEGVDLVDRNGDGDMLDTVVTMRDGTSGELQPLGAPAACVGSSSVSEAPTPQGRAVVSLHQAPFVFPAVATGGDLVAFLESEVGEGDCDTNQNGSRFDSVARIFRLGPVDLMASAPTITVDAAPVLDGQSIALSNGRVFFRQSEPAMAQRRTERINVDDFGDQTSSLYPWSSFGQPTLSTDGHHVAFVSDSDQFEWNDTNGVADIFLRNRIGDWVRRISYQPNGSEWTGDSSSPAISANGNVVAYLNQVVPYYDPTLFITVVEDESTSYAAVDLDNFWVDAASPSISADGSLISFISRSTRLIASDVDDTVPDIFIAHGTGDYYEKVPNAFSLSSFNEASISGDGRYVVYAGPEGLVQNVFVYDRQTGSSEKVSVSSSGVAGNNDSSGASISADGRYVAFASRADNLVPGDTNGLPDVFVRDRVTQLTERVSITAEGSQGNGGVVGSTSISADGRYVAFDSDDDGLVPGDTNPGGDIPDDAFVYDRLTGMIRRVSVSSSGTEANSEVYDTAISPDGQAVAFVSRASNLVSGDSNLQPDVFLNGPHLTESAPDLTGNEINADLVLSGLDATEPSPLVVPLCPATQVAIAGGAVAFLRPESAGDTPNLPNCPTGTPIDGLVDLNGDGNTSTDCVHLALSLDSIQNLSLAATAVSMSARCSGGANVNRPCEDNSECPGSTCVPAQIAAITPESALGNDLNQDGDSDDGVVEIHPAGPGSWTNLQQAADTVQIVGSLVAFITPEAGPNLAGQDEDLNSDGDRSDRVLQLYDAATTTLTNSGAAAEDLVMGTQLASCGNGPLVAFRTSEATQRADLNGDGDRTDDALQVFVPGVGVVNTGQAVTRCRLEACDPRQPYIVNGDTVKFLTIEADQGRDLNGNGTTTDLILQIFDACTRTLTVIGDVDPTHTGANPLAEGGTTTQSKAVFATTAGFCSDGYSTLLVPATCTSDEDCPDGAVCEGGQIVIAAPALVPARNDSVLVVPKPVNVVLKPGEMSKAITLKVKVTNGDVPGADSVPTHEVQLVATDGTCPEGTVAGLPDFDSKADGGQDSVWLPAGKSKAAKIPLVISAGNFGGSNQTAPVRCALALSVAKKSTDENIDPTQANNSAAVPLSVRNQSNPAASSTADAVLLSPPPMRLSIGGSMTKSKKVKVNVLNADSVPATLTVSVATGDCPAGTVNVEPPNMVTLEPGKKGAVSLLVTATNAAFLTSNKKSPSRCAASVTVSGPGVDPDPSNNTAALVIDIVDTNDFQ